ncbi:MAG: rane dipeptidase [Thermoanaerobaculia bacterium]|jgi:membrane dipeptidase|nr:rane dipeptidase [Thermoanaerobaculia bacterium]
MKKHLALTLFLLVVTPLYASRAVKQVTKPAPPSITVDTHADTPSEFLDHPFDLGALNSRGHFDYPRMKAGGLDAEFFAAYVPAKYANRGAAAYCLKIMETIHEMVDAYPTWVRFATSTAGIRAAVDANRRAILIGIEGGHAIEDSLDLLRAFYRFGARYMTLTHTNTNNWADSSGDEGKHNGLTPFGKQVVLEMNRLGMLVDVSHVSDKTFYDVIEASKAPVIASHSSSRALAHVPRNMTDEMLVALAKNGGVAMVNFYPVFLSDEVAKASKEREEKLKPEIAALKAKDPLEGPEYQEGLRKLMDANPLPKVSWTVIVDHIDHMVKIAGIDHVGLGSDFDGIPAVPAGMEDVSKLPVIRAELKRRGYSEGDVRKIMGENFMRVFAAAEKVAKELQAKEPAAVPATPAPATN